MEYTGFITDIKKDFVICELRDKNSHFRHYIDLPIDMIDNEHRVLGKIFHVDIIDEHDVTELKLEWPEYPNIKEEDIQRRLDALMELKWN